MEGTSKHMIKPTGKTNSTTIVTKKAIHILTVPKTMKINTMTMTNPNIVNKSKQVLKPVQRYEEGK